MVSEDIRCSRCGKRLKHPVFINGKPYGSTCAKKVGGVSFERNLKAWVEIY